MSPKALTAFVFAITALLTVVIGVGLAQRLLDPTGVAVALTSVLTGVVVGTVLRSKSGDDK